MAVRKRIFTINDLRSALDELVRNDESAGAKEIMMEGVDEFTHWNGEFYVGSQGRYFVMERYTDLWEENN